MGASRDWQKVDPDLRSHPAFAHLKAILELSAMETHGLLGGLWAMAYRQAEDGDLTRFKPGAIAAAVGYRGNARDMVSALVEAGFLDRDGDERLTIHDWESWGGAAFASRRKEAEWSRVSRERRAGVKPSPASRRRVPAYTKSVKDLKPIDALPGVEVPKRARTRTSVDVAFNVFWAAYPNKQGKVVAARRWKNMRPVDRECAIEVATAMTRSVEGGLRERDKCPYGSTFLNQRRWEEWYDGDGRIAPPPGYGVPAGLRHDRTTEDNRIVCWRCDREVTPDDLETAVFTDKRGWRHAACTKEEP